MNYQKQTKAQLIQRVEQLESQTLTARFDQLIQEVKLMANDFLKLIEYTYNTGAATSRMLYSLKPIKVTNSSTRITY
jgi:hypothetical protein